MSHLLALTNEPVWPVVSGGRVRMAGLLEALAAAHRITVVCPTHARHGPPGSAPDGVEVLHLPPVRTPVAGLARGLPYLCATLLDGAARQRVNRHIGELEPAAVLLSHSYLAPALRSGQALVVDFQNLETDRQRSLAHTSGGRKRLLHLIESRRAARWEPRVARSAALCLAVDHHDAATLRRWGARHVIVLPNVATPPARPPRRSPADGYALFLGSAGYPPNAEALAWLIDSVWPQVRRRAPAAQLVIAGRGTAQKQWPSTEGVDVRGFVADLAELYDGAAVVLGPVRAGAGTQLKVLSALAHRRVMVVTSYSAGSVPDDQRSAVQIADTVEDFAAATAGTLLDAGDRHRREQLLAVRPPSDWSAVIRPLSDWLSALPDR